MLRKLFIGASLAFGVAACGPTYDGGKPGCLDAGGHYVPSRGNNSSYSRCGELAAVMAKCVDDTYHENQTPDYEELYDNFERSCKSTGLSDGCIECVLDHADTCDLHNDLSPATLCRKTQICPKIWD